MSDLSSQVLVGSDGYLFLTNDTNNIISQVKGEKIIFDQELMEIAIVHYERSVIMRRCFSGEYHSAVIPCKEIAYSQFLPNPHIVESVGSRPVKQYFESPWGNIWDFFYDHEILGDMNDSYPKTDSHWTGKGAFLYFRKFLSNVFPEAAKGMDDIEVCLKTSEFCGDLGKKIGAKEFVTNLSIKGSAKLLFSNNVVNNGCIRWYENESPRVDAKVLVLHDSYCNWALGFVPELFKRTVFVHSFHFGLDMINAVKPDVVLFLQAERFFVRPPKNNIDMIKMISELEVEKGCSALTIPSYERGVARLLRYDRHP